MKNLGKLKIDGDIIKRAQKVKLLLMDCDGVLTDGRLYFTENGEVMKVFHVRDGQGIVSWHRAGYKSGIISGRNLEIVKLRATELGMHYIKACSLDKVRDFQDILQDAKLSVEEVAYIGDDIGDIELMRIVGLPISVADAASEVIEHALYVTRLKGGYGAVREVTDILINSRGQKYQATS